MQDNNEVKDKAIPLSYEMLQEQVELLRTELEENKRLIEDIKSVVKTKFGRTYTESSVLDDNEVKEKRKEELMQKLTQSLKATI